MPACFVRNFEFATDGFASALRALASSEFWIFPPTPPAKKKLPSLLPPQKKKSSPTPNAKNDDATKAGRRVRKPQNVHSRRTIHRHRAMTRREGKKEGNPRAGLHKHTKVKKRPCLAINRFSPALRAPQLENFPPSRTNKLSALPLGNKDPSNPNCNFACLHCVRPFELVTDRYASALSELCPARNFPSLPTPEKKEKLPPRDKATTPDLRRSRDSHNLHDEPPRDDEAGRGGGGKPPRRPAQIHRTSTTWRCAF